MPRETVSLHAFNRGLISPLALARTDIDRTALSAETFTNWMPRNLGSMMLRPGTKYIGTTDSNNAAKLLPFIFSTSDTAICEITDAKLRVWDNDSLITRSSVSTTVANSGFAAVIISNATQANPGQITTTTAHGFSNGDSVTINDVQGMVELNGNTYTVTVVDATNFTIGVDTTGYTAYTSNGVVGEGWEDNDESGGDSTWSVTGLILLTGNGTAAAKREQEVTVAGGDQGTEHALHIDVTRGPVTLRVGSTSGDDDYISETALGAGHHSLTLTPTGNFFIEFSSRAKRQIIVNTCEVEASGTMEVIAPWAEADLSKIRHDQSGDIIYVACSGYQQYKIERRSATSWSIVKYEPLDGPFRTINTGPITITPSAISGNITLTASQPLFKSTNVGGLYRLASTGQTVTASVAAENTFTNAIRVTGVTASRIFTITREGTWVATVTLQRSLESSSGPWEDVTTYTTNATITYDDSLDNQIAWYRIGVKTGDYTSGTVDLTLDYAIGSIDGVCRITIYSSSTSVAAEVITDLGNTDATLDWYEGEWSSRRGFPTSVAIAEGRVGWSGKDKVWLSASDAYETFTDLFTGDSEAISRTIGSGPVDNINWMVATRRLLFGGDSSEFALRSSSDDEPLTPTNANMKTFSTQGSGAVQAIKMDDTAIFIQRGGSRVMEASMGESFDYESADLTTFYPEAGDSSITRLAAQRQPDTRIHCIRTDGDVSILIYEKAENVSCWLTFSTNGSVEDIAVLPGADGDGEDALYYLINRTINGSTVRYLEKWALESQCVGGTVNRQLDSFKTYTGAAKTITGLDHLEGETVSVWGSGKNIGTATVSGGAITLSEVAGDCCVGLSYTAQFKSSKLAYASGLGTALAQKKNISTLGVILRNAHYQGLEYGRNFTNMDNLPLVKDGASVAADTVYTEYDEESFAFSGSWDTDSRLCLQATAPNPCTVLAAIIGIETHDRY